MHEKVASKLLNISHCVPQKNNKRNSYDFATILGNYIIFLGAYNSRMRPVSEKQNI